MSFIKECRKWIMAMLLVFSVLPAGAAEIVLQTGIASPQTESEESNIEVLRKRAIRNALDLAVLQVSGATISSERGGSLASKEETIMRDGNARNEVKEKSRYHSASVSKSTGYTRMVELVREWQEGRQYYVELKVEVGTEEDVANTENAGFYWERAGKPKICMSLRESSNGEDTTQHEVYTLRYIRDNLVRNGITPSEGEQSDCAYEIQLVQEYTINQMTSFDTFTANCRLSFQIQDKQSKETVGEHRAGYGPVAGFNVEQAESACIREIAPNISEKLVRQIARVMNNKWSFGAEYVVTIEQLPGELATSARSIIANLFRVKRHSMEYYRGRIMQLRVHYEGTAAVFTEAIVSAFDDQEMKLVPTEMHGNSISFQLKTYSIQ